MKKLIKNETEYIKLFAKLAKYNPEYVERWLDIEFALKDGKFQSDLFKDNSIDEAQDINIKKYKKGRKAMFPRHYPAVVILSNYQGHDKLGKVEIRFLEFVYPKDFEKK